MSFRPPMVARQWGRHVVISDATGRRYATWQTARRMPDDELRQLANVAEMAQFEIETEDEGATNAI